MHKTQVFFYHYHLRSSSLCFDSVIDLRQLRYDPVSQQALLFISSREWRWMQMFMPGFWSTLPLLCECCQRFIALYSLTACYPQRLTVRTDAFHQNAGYTSLSREDGYRFDPDTWDWTQARHSSYLVIAFARSMCHSWTQLKINTINTHVIYV